MSPYKCKRAAWVWQDAIPSYRCKNGVECEHSTPFYVGMTRLELATSRPPDACANQLRYIPCFCKAVQRYAISMV